MKGFREGAHGGVVEFEAEGVEGVAGVLEEEECHAPHVILAADEAAGLAADKLEGGEFHWAGGLAGELELVVEDLGEKGDQGGEAAVRVRSRPRISLSRYRHRLCSCNARFGLRSTSCMRSPNHQESRHNQSGCSLEWNQHRPKSDQPANSKGYPCCRMTGNTSSSEWIFYPP